ncbi:hemerythrin domain-containing protein [Prauserella muralis]|uniref:Hemerythrin n=1 Tax=Prauserella muralis TaxID=588067 RepID=A0A2V4B147_9PSEU|nr:hemerythrin domain-containing protein [Prauserella muralis]PXY27747.1 hemerythrin [Prauserella muralis]TWE22501.1 hemerythrin HHE cation binding domain-containing protein [Prauserella muralis]
MDAIELLRKDHQNVLAMLDRLETGPTAASGADNDVLDARKQLVTELVIAESQHEAIEEQFFWPMVRDSVPGGQELAAQATEQEAEAKKLLDALDKAAPTQPEFEQLLGRVIADGREHIEYEQTQVWPKVQQSVEADRLAQLGDKMAKAKQTAPTRPHPATPSSPAAQKTAGPLAAMLDKARDMLSGRRK